MECKERIKTYAFRFTIQWNISRMECKGGLVGTQFRRVPSGIYPEWNVKKKLKAVLIEEDGSGIYPEWNVKK